MSQIAQPVFFCCGFFAATFNSVRALFVAVVYLLNAAGNSFVKAWNVISNLYRITSTRVGSVFLLLLIILTGVGIVGVYQTSPTLNSIDKFNECTVLPVAEFIVKVILLPIRDIYREVSAFWNTGIRYLYDTCGRLLYESLSDWLEETVFIVEEISGLSKSGYDASLLKFADYSFGIADVVFSLAEIPYFLFKFAECASFFWTEPHPLFIYPDNQVVNAPGREPVAYYNYYPETPGELPEKWPSFESLQDIPEEYQSVRLSARRIGGFRSSSRIGSLKNGDGAGFSIPDRPNVSQRNEFGIRSWEFNPMWGAFKLFPDSPYLRYARRVVVGAQVIIVESYRATYITYRLFRRANLNYFWEALVVKVTSSLSLWRIYGENVARMYGAVSIVAPSFGSYCDGVDVPQNSRIRTIIDFVSYGILRQSTEVSRYFSLVLYSALTTRAPGGLSGSTPVLDLVADIIDSTQTSCAESKCLTNAGSSCSRVGTCYMQPELGTCEDDPLFDSIPFNRPSLDFNFPCNSSQENPCLIPTQICVPNGQTGFCGLDRNAAQRLTQFCRMGEGGSDSCTLDRCFCETSGITHVPCQREVFQGINLLKLEKQWCFIYAEVFVDFDDIFGQQPFPELQACPFWPNHYSSGIEYPNSLTRRKFTSCPEWDGISFETWTPEARIAYVREAVFLIKQVVRILRIISGVFNILFCDLRVAINIIDRIADVLNRTVDSGAIGVQVIQAVVYAIIYIPCSIGADALDIALGFSRLLIFIVDEFFNRFIPSIIAIITGIDCSNEHNLIECIISQAAAVENSAIFPRNIEKGGAFFGFCKLIDDIMENDFIPASILDPVEFTTTSNPIRVQNFLNRFSPSDRETVTERYLDVIDGTRDGLRNIGITAAALEKLNQPLAGIPPVLSCLNPFTPCNPFGRDVGNTAGSPIINDPYTDPILLAAGVTPKDFPVVGSYVGALLTCSRLQIDLSAAYWGPIKPVKRKRSGEFEEESELDEIYYKLGMMNNTELFRMILEMRLNSTQDIQRDSPYESLKEKRIREVSKFQKMRKWLNYEDNQKDFTQLLRNKSEITYLAYTASKYSSDFRKIHDAARYCYVGEYEIDDQKGFMKDETYVSQYDMCVNMSMETIKRNGLNGEGPATINKYDIMCIKSRCFQLTMDCYQNYITESLHDGEPNLIDSSAFMTPIKWAANTAAWFMEAEACPMAYNEILKNSTTKASHSMRSSLGFLSLANHFVYEWGHVMYHYMPAYYVCLSRSRALNANRLTENYKEIIIDYVHCLEEPYVHSKWNPDLSKHNSSLSLWREYISNEQIIESKTSKCYALLHENGLRFDFLDQEQAPQDFYSEEAMYQFCLFSHAFGTRAVLAASVASLHGGSQVGSIKLHSRDSQQMWRPMQGARTLEPYMGVWSFMMSAPRSAEFITGSMFEYLDWFVRSVGDFFVSVYEVSTEMSFTATKIFKAISKRGYIQSVKDIASIQRAITTMADVYDDVLNPPSAKNQSDRDEVIRVGKARLTHPNEVDMKVTQAVNVVKEEIDYWKSKNVIATKSTEKKSANEMTGTKPVKKKHTEVFMGEDENGWEIYELSLDNQDYGMREKDVQDADYHGSFKPKPSVSKWNAEDFELPQSGNHWLIPGTSGEEDKHGRMGERFLYDRNPAMTNRSEQFVGIDFESRRMPFRQDRVYVYARVNTDADVISSQAERRRDYKPSKLCSKSWQYSPHKHIDIGAVSEALKRFINNTMNLNEARRLKKEEGYDLSLDLSDAEHAIEIIDNIRGISYSPTLNSLVDYGRMKRAIDVSNGRHMDHEELGQRLARSVSKYEPLNVRAFGTAISVISKMIDRRMRIKDNPAVQNAAMVIDLLSTGDVEMISQFMAGSVRYIIGVGFVPRMAYEQYMQSANDMRESMLLPFSHGVGYTEMRLPSFFPSYHELKRLAEESKLNRGERNEKSIERRNRRKRKRTAERMYATMAKRGHLKEMFHNGDEHTWHELQLLVPHYLDDFLPSRGVDVEAVKELMHTTTREKRSELQSRQIEDAAEVMSRQTEESGNMLTFFIDIVKFIFSLFFDEQEVEDWFDNLWQDFLDLLETLGDYLGDFLLSETTTNFIEGFVCNVPNDIALDGTGRFNIGCLFQGYITESLFEFVSVWPNAKNSGRIHWSNDAYTANTSECITGKFDTEDFCVSDEDSPAYVSWSTAFTSSQELCKAYRKNGASRQCNKLGLGARPSAVHPHCPDCAYCVREYKTCEVLGFGVDPVRVLQVYYEGLRQVWDEIWDVNNDFVILSAWFILLYVLDTKSLIFSNIWSFFRFNAFLFFLSITLYGLLVDSQTFLYPLVFIFVIHFFSDGVAFVFQTTLILRALIRDNIDFVRDLVDIPDLSEDPLDFDLPPIFSGIADALEWIGKWPCFIPYTCVNPSSIINDNTDFFINAEQRLRIYENDIPSSFETVCSIFGAWTVFSLFFVAYFVLSALDIGAGIFFGAIGLGLAVAGFVIIVVGYISLGWLVLSIVFMISLARSFSRRSTTVQYTNDPKRRKSEKKKGEERNDFDQYEGESEEGGSGDGDGDDDVFMKRRPEGALSSLSSFGSTMRRRKKAIEDQEIPFDQAV